MLHGIIKLEPMLSVSKETTNIAQTLVILIGDDLKQLNSVVKPVFNGQDENCPL